MARMIDADELMESIRKALGIKSMTKSLLLPAERTIIDQIDDAPTIGGWISVKDRIPENDRSYLTIGPRGVMRVAKAYVPAQVLKAYGGDPNYVLWTCEGRFVKATHWMPLPEPPKGDDA